MILLISIAFSQFKANNKKFSFQPWNTITTYILNRQTPPDHWLRRGRTLLLRRTSHREGRASEPGLRHWVHPRLVSCGKFHLQLHISSIRGNPCSLREPIRRRPSKYIYIYILCIAFLSKDITYEEALEDCRLCLQPIRIFVLNFWIHLVKFYEFSFFHVTFGLLSHEIKVF